MTTIATGRLAGLRADTVRSCKRNGLLRKPARRPSGYREYGPADVDCLHFIRRSTKSRSP